MLYRTRGRRSYAVMAREDERLEGWGKESGRARGFWNVWERGSWEMDGAKARVVVQVDESGTARPLSFGDDPRSPLIVRVQPLTGGLSRSVCLALLIPNKVLTHLHRAIRLSFSARDSHQPEEIVPTTSVARKILHAGQSFLSPASLDLSHLRLPISSPSVRRLSSAERVQVGADVASQLGPQQTPHARRA